MEMSSNSVLTKANRQWESRPADERFGSLADLHAAATRYRTAAAVAKITENALRVVADGDRLQIEGKTGTRADLNNWTFGQVAERAKAPTPYLKTLPTQLAADCLNASLKQNATKSNALALFDKGNGGGSPALRAITSDKYSRIWNADITSRLLDLEARARGNRRRQAFDGSRGLYLGDRDMFAFMVDNERRIFETGPGGGLSRGFFAWNSEVGSRPSA
jgi:hypothetical protein